MNYQIKQVATVKECGQVYEIDGIWYDKGITELSKVGADFTKMTVRNIAYMRTQLPFDNIINMRGNWLFEEIVYNVEGYENPILVLGNGPVFNNASKAAVAHDTDTDLYIDDTDLKISDYFKEKGDRWDIALTRTLQEEMSLLKQNMINPMDLHVFELPTNKNFRIELDEMKRIDSEKLHDPKYFNSLSAEAQVFALLLKDQIALYAEKVLQPSMIMNLLIMLQNRRPDPEKDKVKRSYAQPLWIGSVTPGCGSCIVGCICGNWMRGIKVEV